MLLRISKQLLHASQAVTGEVLYRGLNKFFPGDQRLLPMIPISALDGLKMAVSPLQLKYRVDVTGLLEEGVSLASDLRSKHRGPLAVSGGWDQSHLHDIPVPADPIDPSHYLFSTYETVRLMFRENADYDQTPEFRNFEKSLSLGGSPYGIRSPEELKARGDALSLLHTQIRSGKYSEEAHTNPWDCLHIYLYADGSLCAGRHANHRLAIARLTGLDSMPVRLGGVHIDFLKHLHFGLNVTVAIPDLLLENLRYVASKGVSQSTTN